MAKSPERIAEIVATIRHHRTTTAPFEVAVDGYSEAGAHELPRLRSSGGDLVAGEHTRHARYAGRVDGSGEGEPPGSRMRSSPRKQRPNAEIAMPRVEGSQTVDGTGTRGSWSQLTCEGV